MKLVYYILITAGIFIFACKPATSPPDKNSPPNTTLTNIPVQNDTLFPLVEFTWDGGDDDGYIVGCEYSYSTHHLDLGDSVKFDWVKTEDQVVNIIFESSDRMNLQHLKVRAIDNNGAVDPTPAELFIYTPRTILPVSQIVFPEDNNQFFYLDSPIYFITNNSCLYQKIFAYIYHKL